MIARPESRRAISMQRALAYSFPSIADSQVSAPSLSRVSEITIFVNHPVLCAGISQVRAL